MKLYIFLISILLFCLACEKEMNTTEVISPLYLCCNFYDIWDCDEEEGDQMTRIRCFFEKEDIEVYNLSIEDAGTEIVCVMCCKCPSNENLVLDVANEDLQSMLDLGFEVN